MAIIYIVRHGRAAASFTDDLDPALDDLGRRQAEAACETLARCLPLQLRSSPLRRAVETGEPLSRKTGIDPTIDARVAEIPSPGLSLAERGPWLRDIMQGRWSDQSADLQRWRQSLIDALVEVREDTAIFSHFVAINVAVGAAESDDRVIVFRPDNGSITRLEVADGKLNLLERGSEADTRVN
ncbi:MAG TPA: histidine phosphatase family protein [Pseudomonadales bacterium]|nr:histidine phosphatase family protein [Pseudomonadales bacterium]